MFMQGEKLIGESSFMMRSPLVESLSYRNLKQAVSIALQRNTLLTTDLALRNSGCPQTLSL
jgi:hypothetical protein